MTDFSEHDAISQAGRTAGELTGTTSEDARFTSYNVRLQDSLKKARSRQQDSSSVFQLPNSKPAKTDSYAGRLKSQLRRLRERTASSARATDAPPAAAASRIALDDSSAEQGFTD